MGNLTYLITGANRGLGRQFVMDLLGRPDTTVLATVRDPGSDTARSLGDLTAAQGSRLHVLRVDDKISEVGYGTIPARLGQMGVTQVDVAIANAGYTDVYNTMRATDPEEVRCCFEVNAVGPLKLLQACWPLLQQAGGGKFVLMTSVMGSKGSLDEKYWPGLAYGMSKAAANLMAKKVSIECRDAGLLVGIIEPGWSRTSMGQAFGDFVGEEPPLSVEESSRRVLQQIDKLSFATTHGKFINNQGQELPW
ncbi:hypothetical protein HIM_08759 [Hirsutella minnesotensis 3608]|uniref:Uncharacterized protein n=1 Tax=Hirsutella minnesotensis 3608 TaxID=1043627 RepID=A0A0F7ZH11_9HYPO|nr:hypothetical protein HIM_08759 [Hirsutella minnesotensis 3608]